MHNSHDNYQFVENSVAPSWFASPRSSSTVACGLCKFGELVIQCNTNKLANLPWSLGHCPDKVVPATDTLRPHPTHQKGKVTPKCSPPGHQGVWGQCRIFCEWEFPEGNTGGKYESHQHSTYNHCCHNFTWNKLMRHWEATENSLLVDRSWNPVPWPAARVCWIWPVGKSKKRKCHLLYIPKPVDVSSTDPVPLHTDIVGACR